MTPHTLRHTAATWLMQAGVDKWERLVFSVCRFRCLIGSGHHPPHHLRQAANAIGYRRRNETLSVSLSKRKPADPAIAQAIGGPGRTRTCNQTAEPTDQGARDKSRLSRRSIAFISAYSGFFTDVGRGFGVAFIRHFAKRYRCKRSKPAVKSLAKLAAPT